MIQGFLHQLDELVRRAVPLFAIFFLVLLTVAASPIPQFASLTPSFALIAVYYWSVHRPDLLPLPALFALGLILDALMRLPLGLSALSFILAARWVQGQRHIFSDRSYATLWFGFAVVAAVTAALQWMVAGLLAWHMLPAWPLCLQTLLTIAVFPLFAWSMILLQRHIVH
ncbi:MAG: rod shape-determining protein MreD [Alphaproteobacteria bacterium]